VKEGIRVIISDYAHECMICGKYIKPKVPYVEISVGDSHIEVCIECVATMYGLLSNTIISGGDTNGVDN